MRTLKLKWQLFPSYVVILICAMLAVAWYNTHSFKKFYVGQMTVFLEAQSSLILPRVSELTAAEKFAELNFFCRETGRRVSTRITVIKGNGDVVCDSDEDPGTMQNHAGRPEVAQALAGNNGSSQRFSTTTKQQMLYVAIPVRRNNTLTGVLRTSVPLTAIETELQSLNTRITMGIVIVIVFASAVTFFIAKKISQPLEQMKSDSLRFAHGNFREKISVTGSEEIVGLARAMNRMALQLDERMRTILSKSNELETVLSSMVEGVIAVDLDEKVLYINESAQKQLDIDQHDVQGKRLLEIVRNIELLRFIQHTLSHTRQTEKTIIFNLGKRDERILQVHGAQLYDEKKQRIGALVVTNDVSRLLQLENLRRDFVANVSHELKTPITSIKGYAETLMDETGEYPQHVKDFLEIISKQTNRLQAIVEDLLSLAEIEQKSDGSEEMPMEKERIVNVLRAAIEACSIQAADRNIQIRLDCAENMYALINGPLLEQAVINLLDNAIKYSKPGGVVQVETSFTGGAIFILIKDSGIGIAPQHLERLFERFYVVDKGRSRESGGTGLGLAIVKHIIQAHGGSVKVESQLHEGSIFTICLPGV